MCICKKPPVKVIFKVLYSWAQKYWSFEKTFSTEMMTLWPFRDVRIGKMAKQSRKLLKFLWLFVLRYTLLFNDEWELFFCQKIGAYFYAQFLLNIFNLHRNSSVSLKCSFSCPLWSLSQSKKILSIFETGAFCKSNTNTMPYAFLKIVQLNIKQLLGTALNC